MTDAHPSARRQSPSRSLLFAAAILAGAGVAGMLGLRAARGGAAPAVAHPARPAVAAAVTAAAAAEARWPVQLQATGAIAAWQEVVVGAQVSGVRLVELGVNVGDRVKRGQLLARFDDAALKINEAQLEASWRQAEANRQRALQLKGSGSMSEQELLQYVTQADVAKAPLDAVRLQLLETRVVAPDDGTIAARSATLGAISTPGQELFRLIRRDKLEWRGELSAAQLASIAPGQRVHLALPDGNSASAIVRQTAPGVDTQTRLGTVFADIERGSRARPGMYAQGSVDLADSAVIVVPAASVIIRDGRSYVIVVSEGDRASERRVETGRYRDDAIELISGLKAGERVVAQGAGFLYDGDAVHVVSPAASATSAATKERP